MKKSINLSIPKPCTEKWENFTLTSHGGFCSSCSKTVIDFKNASEKEIFDFFRNKPAHACGRFRPDQLKTYSFNHSVSTINPGFALFKAGFIGLTFLLISRPSVAQQTPAPIKKEIVDQQGIKNTDVVDEGRIFKGIVLAQEDDSPLPGVNVVLKGFPIGTATDSDGRFEFPQKLKEGDVLVITFIGLRSEEYRIPKESKDITEFKMFYMELDMTGEVAVTDVYEQPSTIRRFWSKVKGIF